MLLTVMVQVAAGSTEAQVFWGVKSAGAVVATTCRATLPVLVRVMVWAGEASPTMVEAKVSEPCERVYVASVPELLGLAAAGPA